MRNEIHTRKISPIQRFRRNQVNEIGYSIAEFIWKNLPKKLKNYNFYSDSQSEVFQIMGMMIDSLECPPLNEDDIVSRLVVSFKKAKCSQKIINDEYLPGADWKKLLDAQWLRCTTEIDNNNLDYVKHFLRNFFRNEGLSGFWGADRMFEKFSNIDGVASVTRANAFRMQLKTWLNFNRGTPLEVLEAPHIGNPWGYVVDGILLVEPIFEYNHQSRYFANLLSGFVTPVILEIGGGFGGLAYQILKGNQKCKYIGFDLPENVMLQSYYLSSAFPNLRFYLFEDANVYITKELLEKYDVILLPNFMLGNVDEAICDLIVNVRSLSEMPLVTINEYLRQIDRIKPTYFYHENISSNRLDLFHGIPSDKFPSLENFVQVAKSESRWPNYNYDSVYPCDENLFINAAKIV